MLEIYYCLLFIIALIISTGSLSAQVYDVNRFAASFKDGNEPYHPSNTFVNENKLCYFAYCWNMNAKCLNTYGCCQCVCNEGSTFYSSANGCKTPSNLRGWTESEGTECLLYSSTLGRNYVPLFFDPKKFSNIELSMFADGKFAYYDRNSSCSANYLYEYDYHGHRVLLDINKCESIFKMTNDAGFHYIHFVGENTSIWDGMRGKLLALNINCNDGEDVLETCVLFQIEGKYKQGAHKEEPPTLPPDYECPTLPPQTTTTHPPIVSTTVQHNTTAYITTTIVQTLTDPVEGIFLPVSSESETSQTGVIAAVVTVCLVLIAFVVIGVIMVKRNVVTRKTFKRRTTMLLASFRSNKNEYEDTSPVGVYTEADEAPSQEESTYLTAVTDRNYQYIPTENEPISSRHDVSDDEHLYEPTNNLLSPDASNARRSVVRHSSSVRSETDMRTRPLPATPNVEVHNPYYRPASQIESENEDSGPNKLYSIYTSIDEEEAI